MARSPNGTSGQEPSPAGGRSPGTPASWPPPTPAAPDYPNHPRPDYQPPDYPRPDYPSPDYPPSWPPPPWPAGATRPREAAYPPPPPWAPSDLPRASASHSRSDGGERAGDGDVPATTAAGWGWMMIAALGYLVGQVASALFLVVVAAANGNLHDVSRLAAQTVPPGWVTVTGLVGLWTGFVGSVFVASRINGTGNVRRDMGLRFRPVDFVIGPLVGVGGQFILLPLLYLPLEHVVHNLSQRLSEPAKHLTGGFPGADLAVIGVLTVLVVPVVEELVFRGLFLRGALRAFSRAGPRLGPVLAVVCTGVVFGLAHLEALETLGLAAFGMVLAYLAYRERRLGPCIVAHASFNLVAVIAVATVGGLH